MENNVQTQKAGDGAQQFQANQIIINQGITEERARSIFTEMIQQSVVAYTQDAYETVYRRIDKLENVVFPRLARIDGALEHFADPAFQIVLRKAEQSAAATEREEDYSMLAELLACHVQKGENRINRAAIHRAIEIVDLIDNDALMALTICTAIMAIVPNDFDCSQGLKTEAGIYESLMCRPLPADPSWTEHLEMLGALKMVWGHKTGELIRFHRIKMSGYDCAGIKKDSKEFERAYSMLRETKLSPDFWLRDNEILGGFVRLPIPCNQDLESLRVCSGTESRQISSAEVEVLKSILSLYTRDVHYTGIAEENFTKLWHSFPVFTEISKWWEQIPTAFVLTNIGRILAQTNAKRLNSNMPDLV